MPAVTNPSINRSCVILTGLISLTVFATPAAAEFSARLATLQCLTCHRLEAGPSLDLTALSAEQIEQALLEFKHGTRPALLMNRISKGFTDRELGQIARRLAIPQ